jgi:excinuclease ABC subunit A
MKTDCQPKPGSVSSCNSANPANPVVNSVKASVSDQAIAVFGAREHNLKNLSLVIPRNRFIVVTGVSGSGKSTLAFDILFAEGQRRFLDSMNVYARQFVDQLARPDVDLITGIPPTVSIEQRTSRGGGKSTVATVTEIYHFIRLLFARLGTQYCPDCQIPVEAQTRDELGRRLQAEQRKRGELWLLAPVVKNRKGFHTDVAEWAANHGYTEVRADGKLYSTGERLRLDRFREHDVEIVTGLLDGKRRGTAVEERAPLVSKSPTSDNARMRRPRSCSARQLIDETLKLGNGMLLALDKAGQVSVHSTERACPKCGRSFALLDPKNFSYNSPQGWCPRCRGFGELFYLPDVDRGARADDIEESWFSWQEGSRELCPDCQGARLNPVARAVRLDLSTPGHQPSTAPTIDTFSQMSVEAAHKFFSRLRFTGRAATIARDILPEIRERLRFLSEVGLGYIQLGRGVPTLSGGESQRIRLAAQLGSNLSGVLYILDEPTIGLHARDNEQLLAALERLKGRGNSVLVVEHDEETMRRADYIIDLGPGAGVHGGELVAAGTLAELLRHPESITGKCLRARKTYPSRGNRRPVNASARPRPSSADLRSAVAQTSSLPNAVEFEAARLGRRSADYKSAAQQTGGLRYAGADARQPWLTLRNASKNNLKDLTVRFPLGRLVLVTGVSGSGKSTLIRECLLPALQAQLKTQNSKLKTSSLAGFESIHAVYEVDQSPIGRTPRSVPATYVGFFNDIRQLFAQVPEARLRGYLPGRFSFNSPQGRCPECQGAGTIKLEMSFLPPAFVRCEVCGGTRFNRETLDIEYHGKNIAQVLDLSVEEAMEFFASLPRIKRPLQALCDTGLNYLKLGQTSPTLSGGEAQRVKLVTHLLAGLPRGPEAAAALRTRVGRDEPPAEMPSLAEGHLPKHNLFILEEPTIGLHMADVQRLVEVLQRLVDAGHSVIVIEHNLELIAEADWVIDLGPEGGEGGGRIVAQGAPEQIVRNKHSHTGRFLAKELKKQ